VLNVLALIGFARRAGFSIAETKLLITGFGADVTASTRWRAMVSRKQSELDSVIADARRMKKLLQMVADNCECPALEECGRQMRIRNEVTTT
jgi:DNA-binding transcriptional MerR regulator